MRGCLSGSHLPFDGQSVGLCQCRHVLTARVLSHGLQQVSEMSSKRRGSLRVAGSEIF